MFKKWLTTFFTGACVCLATLAAGSASARDITFNLRDANGPVTQESYPGKYLLLAIGYTSCPDICPTTLYEYAQAMKDVRNMDALQPVFVTIDPVNDEITRLTEYTRFFDPRIVGLTGEMKNIEDLANQLGATFGYRLDGKKIDKPELGMSYTVYHSSLIYLIGPDRKLLDVFDYQIGAKGLADALNKALPPSGQAPAAKSAKKAAATPKAAPATAKADGKTAHAADGNAACPLPDGFAPAQQTLALTDVLSNPPAAKATLLNVWALWCAPCRVELPLLDKLAASQQGLKVQTLNLNDKTADVAALFAKMNLVHLPQTGTQDRDLLSRINAKGLPYTGLFINGRLAATKTGIINRIDSLQTYGECMARQ